MMGSYPDFFSPFSFLQKTESVCYMTRVRSWMSLITCFMALWNISSVKSISCIQTYFSGVMETGHAEGLALLFKGCSKNLKKEKKVISLYKNTVSESREEGHQLRGVTWGNLPSSTRACTVINTGVVSLKLCSYTVAPFLCNRSVCVNFKLKFYTFKSSSRWPRLHCYKDNFKPWSLKAQNSSYFHLTSICDVVSSTKTCLRVSRMLPSLMPHHMFRYHDASDTGTLEKKKGN